MMKDFMDRVLARRVEEQLADRKCINPDPPAYRRCICGCGHVVYNTSNRGYSTQCPRWKEIRRQILIERGKARKAKADKNQ